MAGLFTRVKTWLKLETLKTADINAEFDNVITNFIPAKIDDYSSSVSQMRIQTNPGTEGAESQATSMAGEIERLRYVINRALGTTYWYDNPNTSLTALAISAQTSKNRIDSGLVNTDSQPSFLVPDTGTNANVRLKASATNLVVYIDGVLITVTADLVLALASSSTYSLAVNDATLTGTQSSKSWGENDTVLGCDTSSGAAPTANTYQAWKIVHSSVTEYFYAQYDSSTQLSNAKRGNFFNTSAAAIPRVPTSDNDVITLCRAAYIFFTYPLSVPTLEVTYNKPAVSFDIPAAPSSGDFWLDLGTGIWKKYNGSAFVDAMAVFIGIAVVDGSNCVAARSMDISKGFAATNSVTIENIDVATVRGKELYQKISVYGSTNEFFTDRLMWSMTADLDSGITESANTTYYFYVTSQGDKIISDVAPHDRRFDLLGFYHTHKPWRCVGSSFNDGSSNLGVTNQQDLLTAGTLADGSITNSKIVDASITTAKVVDANITRPKLVAVGQVISTTCGNYVYTGAVQSVTNLTVTITTTGRPVILTLVSDGSASSGLKIDANTSTSGISAIFSIRRNGSDIVFFNMGTNFTTTSSVGGLTIPPGSTYYFDPVAAGTYTYAFRASTNFCSLNILNCQFLAYEL